MSMKDLKKAVKKSKDEFEIGTVIRWTASDRYTYAAIKTSVGWFTTAREYNSFVDKVMTFEGILDVVARAETTNVMVATAWTAVE